MAPSATALAGAVLCALVGCGVSLEEELGLPDAQCVPAQSIGWKSVDGRGFGVWGGGGPFLFGTSGPSEGKVVDVWQWSGDAVVAHRERYPLPKDGTLALAWLGGRYVAESHNSRDNAVVCRDPGGGKVLKRWSLTTDWYCPILRTSRNGRYLALGVSSNIPGVMEGARKRLGILGAEMGEIGWLPPLKAPNLDGDTSLSTIIPSDDGAYVAVAGWKNGAGVYDVATKRLLWYTRPKEEARLDDIAFAPDSTRVYTGGVMGSVYVMETATGKILGRWPTTRSGRDVYGHRIVTVAASPDGRWVAAGTGPIGLAYVWRAATGERVKVLNHGGSTILILSFSPDSKSLATYAKGKIKVWRMPDR